MILITIVEPTRIVAEVRGAKNDTDLLKIGFIKEGEQYTISCPNEVQQINILSQLAHINVLFSYGLGWAPSEVLLDLKEQEKITFPFQVITWKSPGIYEVLNF